MQDFDNGNVSLVDFFRRRDSMQQGIVNLVYDDVSSKTGYSNSVEGALTRDV